MPHPAPGREGPDVVFPRPRAITGTIEQPICTIVVDAEEDFDWSNPARGVDLTTTNMFHIRTLQEIAGAYGIQPTYLLTYPVLDTPEVVEMLRYRLERNECELGVQLHPWVTPPYDDQRAPTTSFAGSLPPEQEALKLVEMTRKFRECFGTAPQIYRAGRYGLGANSLTLLEELGFRIDTSMAPRTSYRVGGGPDFTQFGYRPFWFGETATLLEIPLCRDVVGWSGRLAPRLYEALARPPFSALPALAAVARLRCAERITLSPEGNDLRAMARLVRKLHDAGERVFVVSLHSSSLAIGKNPYVRTKFHLHQMYDRLSGILDFMAREYAVTFTSLSNVPELLGAPAP